MSQAAPKTARAAKTTEPATARPICRLDVDPEGDVDALISSKNGGGKGGGVDGELPFEEDPPGGGFDAPGGGTGGCCTTGTLVARGKDALLALEAVNATLVPEIPNQVSCEKRMSPGSVSGAELALNAEGVAEIVVRATSDP